jgi:uncharacterized protein YuzB (UPF0349 family)
MRIARQNSFIEISELGFNLEIKTDLLLNTLISETTRNILNQMIRSKLNELKPHFEEINTIIELEHEQGSEDYFNSLKEKRNVYIYEYVCLSRELSYLCNDAFVQFYEDNIDLMQNIYRVFQYSSLYKQQPDTQSITL